MEFPRTTLDQAAAVIKVINMDPDATSVIEESPTNLHHMQTILDAFHKFVERNNVYVDLWKEGGVEDSARNASSKVARLKAINVALKLKEFGEHPMDTHEKAMYESGLDSAIDGINYFAFAARNLHSRRLDDAR